MRLPRSTGISTSSGALHQTLNQAMKREVEHLADAWQRRHPTMIEEAVL